MPFEDAPTTRPGATGDAPAAPTWPEIERRRRADRRTRPTSLWQALFLRGERARGRRQGEASCIYVDVYQRREIGLVVAVLALNVLDALLTLDYLQKGGREANPLAQSLLDLGSDWFLFAKSFVVGGCLVFLLVHKTFPFVLTALRLLTFFYGALFAYHLFLQARYYLGG